MPPTETPTEDPPPLPVDDDGCAPAPTAVPFLPRTSNDEVRQLTADLLGGAVDPALFVRWTPLAQVRGFDTMTESRIDQQTLEEQLRTMETVASALVASPSVLASCPLPTQATPVCALHDAYDFTAQFSGVQGQDCWSAVDDNGGVLVFNANDQRFESATDPGLFSWSTGMHPGIGVDVRKRFTVAVDGSVHVVGSVSDADPGGGDGVVVEVRHGSAGAAIGDQALVFQDVIVNGGAGVALDVTVTARRGDVIDLVVRRNADNAYDSTAVSLSMTLTPTPSTDGLSWESCARGVVAQIGSRAFRRPLRAEELADLQAVFDDVRADAVDNGEAAPFYSALEAALEAALLSPNVHYKPELVPALLPGGFAADEQQFRRAARLALYFRSSFPDDALWTAAEQGQLTTDEQLRAQAERLLHDDADRFVDNFAGQWLDFRAQIGLADDELTTSSRREAHDVFVALLNEGAAPTQLITPGFTIVDDTLAGHYGIALPGQGPSGTGAENAGPQRVVTNERGGLFTQAHFLRKSATGSDFKRVIHRGIYTLNRALCTSVPELDPATREEIADSFSHIDQSLPLGDRMQLHRNTSQRCQNCHDMMDPLGLALERYDEQGRARDAYADGSSVDNDFDFYGTSVRNPDELSDFVKGAPEFHRCVAEKLLTFGLHLAPTRDDKCVLRAIEDSSSSPRSLHDITIDAFLASLRLTETE